jgi:hypothetical protein
LAEKLAPIAWLDFGKNTEKLENWKNILAPKNMARQFG